MLTKEHNILTLEGAQTHVQKLRLEAGEHYLKQHHGTPSTTCHGCMNYAQRINTGLEYISMLTHEKQ